MNTDFIREQILHMTPSSLSAREQHLYRAEKIVMRQFLLMKQRHKVPNSLSVKDLKKWLLGGRSFLEEFEETAKVADVRKLLMAELAWTSARRLCLNQMEQELHEELQREKNLSTVFGRKVTLEGLHMLLFTFHPKAEQHVRFYLDHLSDQLFSISCAPCGSCNLTLHPELQRAFAPLEVKLVDAALDFLLCEAEELVLSRYSSLASALGSRAEAISARMGEQVAEAAASCFSLKPTLSEPVLKHLCTSVALEMVRDLHRGFDQCSKRSYLLDFDGSVRAREAATFAIQDMEDKTPDRFLLALLEWNTTPMRCAMRRTKQAMMKWRTQRPQRFLR